MADMDNYSPDWVERNGAWSLSLVGILVSCFSGLLVYALKSRCTRIKVCGCTECERDVLDLDPSQVRVESNSA